MFQHLGAMKASLHLQETGPLQAASHVVQGIRVEGLACSQLQLCFSAAAAEQQTRMPRDTT